MSKNSNFLIWLKKIAPNSRNFISFSKYNPNFSSIEQWVEKINNKIWEKNKKKEKVINFEKYDEYFSTLKSLGLWEDFQINTTKDDTVIKGSVINSPIINKNNRKTIFFCHGVTSNRWGLFYCLHLILQMGYQAVIYDARNHGMSQKSYTTLGRIESFDLEDIVNWVKKRFNPEKIGFYGFSMGSATLLFWISYFQDSHPEVSFVICEAPLDDFSKRFKNFLNLEEASENSFPKGNWKHQFFYNLTMKILNSPMDIMEIKPIADLPKKLNFKLLLLHGTNDRVIPPESSLEIWKKINQEEANKKMVDLYFFNEADHDEIQFFGDFFPNNIRWIKEREKISNFCFSSLIFSFLKKNF